MDSNPSNKGFSLVELIIAIGLVAVLTAIAIPNLMQSLPKYRLQSAARDLYSNMQKAKMNAVMQSRNWAIVFDGPTDVYHLCPQDGNVPIVTGQCETIDLTDYGSGVRFGYLPGVTRINREEPPVIELLGESITFADNFVTFDSRGRLASGNGECYLVNQRMDENFAVEITDTSLIKLQKWTGSEWWDGSSEP